MLCYAGQSRARCATTRTPWQDGVAGDLQGAGKRAVAYQLCVCEAAQPCNCLRYRQAVRLVTNMTYGYGCTRNGGAGGDSLEQNARQGGGQARPGRTGVEVGEEVRGAVCRAGTGGEGLPKVLDVTARVVGGAGDVAVGIDEVRRLVLLLREARRERADDAADAVGLRAAPARRCR